MKIFTEPDEHFPVPPSANKLYSRSSKQGSYVYKSAEYKQWLGEMTNHLLAYRWLDVDYALSEEGPYEISICANIDRRRDIDNLVKPILDALQYNQIIKNDNLVDKIGVSRFPLIPKNTFRMSVADSTPVKD